MQRDVVRFHQHPVHVRRFDARRPNVLIGDYRIVAKDAHAQSQSLECGLEPDAAAADDPQGLVLNALDRAHGPVVPPAFRASLEQRLHVARHDQQQGDGVGGDFVYSVVGHIGDAHPVRGGGRHVDVVITHAQAGDYLAVGHAVQLRPVDGLQRHDHAVAVFEIRLCLGGLEVGMSRYFQARIQQNLDPRVFRGDVAMADHNTLAHRFHLTDCWLHADA